MKTSHFLSVVLTTIILLLASCNPKEKPVVTTNSVTEITSKSAVVEASVTSDGGAEIVDRGICWSVSQSPTISDNRKMNGSGTGTYTTLIENLENATHYYVRAYATNSEGTSYGEMMDFITSDTSNMDLPEIKIMKIRDITEHSAVIDLELLSDGGAEIIEKGICYNTESSVSIQDNVVKNEDEGNVFTINLTELEDGVKYYIRAYAINEKGISYTRSTTFVTIRIPELPTITTNTVKEITTANAVCEATIEDLGGADFIAKGFCWSTSPEPTLEDEHTTKINNPFPLNFEETIGGNFEDNTTYYVRAYVTNEIGTSYGEELTFKTPDVEYKDGYITIDGVNNYRMIDVEEGTFLRGYQNSDPEGPNYYQTVAFVETPLHYVTLTKPYYIGETEVTQDLWIMVMGSDNSRFKGDRRPVDWLSYDKINGFIERLNKLTGCSFRLPTEAEWEFAARGGNQSEGYTYYGSDNPDDVAVFHIIESEGGKTAEVKSKMPNELGLYDMNGNVEEFCFDNFNSYSGFVYEEYQTILDPVGKVNAYYGDKKVIRGGRINDKDPRALISRKYEDPDFAYFNRGFRLAL